MHAQSFLTLCDYMDYSPQAPLSMEFSRQKYWSGLPFPTPGDLPNPGIEPRTPEPLALTGAFFTTVLPEKTTILTYLVPILYFLITYPVGKLMH